MSESTSTRHNNRKLGWCCIARHFMQVLNYQLQIVNAMLEDWNSSWMDLTFVGVIWKDKVKRNKEKDWHNMSI